MIASVHVARNTPRTPIVHIEAPYCISYVFKRHCNQKSKAQLNMFKLILINPVSFYIIYVLH